MRNSVALRIMRFVWVVVAEVDYVDQVFLCFFVSLKLVTIADKEN